MSLYTLYRPRDWDSVIGQDAISTMLRTSLIQDRVGHAYILTGSRGTGKTTTARILAKGVNCLDLQDGNPCHICSHCVAFDDGNMLDCIEIDGASNNGVENVRDLIEKARFEPNQGKYKIYIIDEVHMLSTGAFNALLKTLEEPPKHVKFILATTEIDKVPETIRSRSLRFDFKKISESDIVKRLEYVCGQEGIKTESEALSIIARAARGALRDALTLTEQNTVNQEISTEYVRSTLSLIEDALIAEIIETIVAKDRDKMTEILATLRTRHAEVRGLFGQILYGLRDAMIASFEGNNSTTSFAEYSDIFAIFESAYGRIKSIPDGGLLIEITLMRAVARSNKTMSLGTSGISAGEFGGSIGADFREKSQTVGPRGALERGSFGDLGNQSENKSQNESEEIKTFGTFGHKSTEETVSKKKGILSEDDSEKETKKQAIKKEDPETSSGGQTQETQKKEQILSEDDKNREQENIKKMEALSSTFNYIHLLEEIKKTKATLVLDLKNARFEYKDTHLTLIFSKEWHYNRVNTPAMKNIIAETLESLYTGAWNIVCRIEGGTRADITEGVF